MPRGYPLEVLFATRKSQATLRERELADCRRQKEQAERAHRDAQDRLKGEQAQLAAWLAEQQERLARGVIRAGDQVAVCHHREHRKRVVDQLRSALSTAISEVARADAQVKAAQDRLAEAYRQVQAVSRHRERFHTDQQKRADDAVDEQATENWSARHDANRGQQR